MENLNTDELLAELLRMQKEERVKLLVEKACENVAKDYVNSMGDVAVIEGKLMVKFHDLVEWVKNNHFIFKNIENKKAHWKYLEPLVYNCLFFTSYIKYKITGKGDNNHIRIRDTGHGSVYNGLRYKIQQTNFIAVCPEFLGSSDTRMVLTNTGTYAIYMFGSMDKKDKKSKMRTYAVIVGSLVISVCPGGIVMYSTFDDKAQVNIIPYKNSDEFWYYLFSIISDPINGPTAYARLMYSPDGYDKLKEKGEVNQFDQVVLMQYCKLSDDPFPLSWMHDIAKIYDIL